MIDIGRLEQQAREISALLAAAGLSAMPIVEAVGVLVRRSEALHDLEMAIQEADMLPRRSLARAQMRIACAARDAVSEL